MSAINMREMTDDVRQEVISRLKSDYGFKQVHDWLRQGRCPACNRREMFVKISSPWVIKCGRENKCGHTAHVKDLYPDAFGKFNERYPATTEDPNRTADRYMDFVRGLNPAKTKGWYRQGEFYHAWGDRKTATVVFDISRGENIFMERLIETVRITDPKTKKVDDRRANFGSTPYKGRWWVPPGQTIEDGDELWIVEGCIDAATLAVHGKKAAAILSAYNVPDKELEKLKGKSLTLVWAMDNDPAGKRHIRKCIAHVDKNYLTFTNKAALIPQADRKKTDWNDAHLANALNDRDIERYRFHGDLFLAKSPMEKALLVWERHKSRSFAVEFDTRTYWFSVIAEVYNAQMTSAAERGMSREEAEPEAVRKASRLEEIANCTFKFLYFQQDKQTDDSWYYTRVEFPHGRHTIKNTFSGGQVATASEFKKRLLSIAPGALYAGNSQQLNWLVKHYLDNIKIVETTDFIGYAKEHGIYVFNDRAVAAGKVIEINDEDFFEVGKTSIKSLNQSLQLHIGNATDYDDKWLGMVYSAYGAKGLIATAFFLGSLFAEQIRGKQKSYPFLEIVGEAGAGKSTLIEFLWKLVGRSDYEGFDPNKSTLAARARIFSQVSNLPICLIESDREDSAKARQFDWDELKTAYNGRASRARGVKNGGNETSEPPFRGSVVISQNAAVNASEAIMQRIIHTHFDTSGHTPASKIAADALAAMPVENASFFLIKAVTREKQILDAVFNRTAHWETELMRFPDIRSNRIAKNHAQLISLVEALAELTNMPKAWHEDAIDELKLAAVNRQRAISADHPAIEEFWEAYDFLGDEKLNHAMNLENTIAINLNHMQSVAHHNNQQIPPLQDLKKLLRQSRSRSFREIKAVRSHNKAFPNKTVKCWIFNREGK
ncbi:toprim domain-containing protein [Thalassospira sp. TSL5-1]|uniref:toprim domain-containing protein n=1 Tax=Thalassospira sp. TSL5-1 TaxID=1544451 RepID=UPI00208E608A|nr:toprim domain-containing protein [Thalassospira sp. TSL5-1]